MAKGALMPIDPRIQAALDAPYAGNASTFFGKRGQTKRKGYAGMPGTGPEGETCGSCAYCHFVQPNIKRFYKYRLTPLTRGPASDIKKRSPACSRWMKADG